ncbi:MAG TPA: hypothetical protein VKH19_05705 [Gemmatimonadaceae bacterium]|nr:hypothetical protein [Gemmatimonadaceae bacterium]
MLESWPPAMVIGLVATIAWATVFGVVGYPLARAWARRLEQRSAPSTPSDVTARLARIESAVDSIALEVERVAEAQRFLTKLQTERQPLPRGENPGIPR